MKHILLMTLLFPIAAFATEFKYTIVIKNHRFQPAELTVPAGKKIKLWIENQDATPEEFDSHPLNREKMIAANGHVMLFIGPLDAGRYSYTGEFNAATAQGVIIAREEK
ncbi:MAG: cupredoxin domain-containing protein [Gallionella sp.]